jgi:hypothetical protein
MFSRLSLLKSKLIAINEVISQSQQICLLGKFYSVGIQKPFTGAEIPGFGLPNRFFGLTTSFFFRDGIVN